MFVQQACKPGSVCRRGDTVAIHLALPLPEASCGQPEGRGPGAHPRLSEGPPIRPCSGWGLPEPYCHQHDGALLPHHCTLTPQRRAVCFCGTFRRLAAPGSYPAPCPKEPGLSSPPQAKGRPPGLLNLLILERLLHFSKRWDFRPTSPLPINDVGNSDSLAPLSLKRES